MTALVLSPAVLPCLVLSQFRYFLVSVVLSYSVRGCFFCSVHLSRSHYLSLSLSLSIYVSLCLHAGYEKARCSCRDPRLQASEISEALSQWLLQMPPCAWVHAFVLERARIQQLCYMYLAVYTASDSIAVVTASNSIGVTTLALVSSAPCACIINKVDMRLSCRTLSGILGLTCGMDASLILCAEKLPHIVIPPNDVVLD
jgi:hypothetical protein